MFSSLRWARCLLNVSELNPDSLWLNLGQKVFLYKETISCQVENKLVLRFENIRNVWPKKGYSQEKGRGKNALNELVVSFSEFWFESQKTARLWNFSVKKYHTTGIFYLRISKNGTQRIGAGFGHNINKKQIKNDLISNLIVY